MYVPRSRFGLRCFLCHLAKPLNQQAGERGMKSVIVPRSTACCLNPNPKLKRGILFVCTSLAHASGWDVSFACGKSIKSTSRQASGCEISFASDKSESHSPRTHNPKTHKKQSNKCDPCVQCMDFICPMLSTNATVHPTFEDLKRNGTSRQIDFRFPIKERP